MNSPAHPRARGRTVAEIRFDVDLDDARQDAHTTSWAQATPLQKAVQLADVPHTYIAERIRLAGQLAKTYPEHAVRDLLSLPPGDSLRKTARPERRLSPKAAAGVEAVFKAEAAQRRRVAAALAHAYPENDTTGKAAPVPGTPVRKAKPDSSQVAVYDENGALVGVVDADSITPLAAAQPAKPKTDPQPAQAPQAAPAAAPMPAEPEEVTKARRGDYQGAGRILKARLAGTHDARGQATTMNALEHLAVAEYARIRRNPKRD